MGKLSLKPLAFIAVLFVLHIIVTYTFTAITTNPSEGDSLAYHIPIAQSVLDGTIIKPSFFLGYYPANAEVLLAVFIFLGVPLNLFNVLAFGIFFFSLYILARTFSLSTDYAFLYATAGSSLHTIVRWLLAQTVDMWLGIFFVFSVICFERLRRDIGSFLLLGISLGLLIGVKYSGSLFAGMLFLIYARNFLKNITLKSVLFFLVPLSLSGFSWYIRNLIVIQNPVYPQKFLFFQGYYDWGIFNTFVWQVIVYDFPKFLNALISEFGLWPFICSGIILHYLFKKYKRNDVSQKDIQRVLIMGLLSLFIFLFLPTTFEYNIVISSFRYSYPAVIMLLLATFRIAQHYYDGLLLVTVLFLSLFSLPSLYYRPKITFVTAAIMLVILLFNKKYKYFNSIFALNSETKITKTKRK